MSVEREFSHELRSNLVDPKLEKIREAKLQGRAENCKICAHGGMRFMG